MVGFTVGGVLLVPLILFLILRGKSIFNMFLLSLPFKTLVLFSAIGHKFSYPEFLIIIVIFDQMRNISRDDIRFLTKNQAALALLSFGIISTISIIPLLIFDKTNLLVHPYNPTKGFGAFELVPLEYSVSNITQVVIRWFTILSILSLGLYLDKAKVKKCIRFIIISSFFVGLIGVLYQLTILVGIPQFAELLHYIGFQRFPTDPNYLGPIPRMYSITGEPGSTATYLLYALGFTITFMFYKFDNEILSMKESVAYSFGLVILLVLTTGTTGYAGFGLLGVVVFLSVAHFSVFSREKLRYASGAGILTVLTGTILWLTLFPDSFANIIEYQIKKLSFSAGSGSIRFKYLSHSIGLFLKQPILGVGVGSHHPTSLFGTILSESGILGISTFLLSQVFIFRDCLKIPPMTNRYSHALVVSGVVLALTLLVARSASALFFPWYWLCLGIPLANTWNASVKSRRIDSLTDLSWRNNRKIAWRINK